MSVKKTFVAGNTLTAADANTYLQNQGTEPIASQTVSGVSSVTFQNCFSSTYRSYQVVFENFTQTTNNSGTYMRIGNTTGGTFTADSTNYYARGIIGGTAVSAYANGPVAQALVHMGYSGTPNGGNMMLYNPFLSTVTTSHSQSLNNATVESWNMHDLHNVNTSWNSIQFFPLSGTMSGTIKIYGLV